MLGVWFPEKCKAIISEEMQGRVWLQTRIQESDEFRISMWISPFSSKSDVGSLSLRLLSLFYNGAVWSSTMAIRIRSYWQGCHTYQKCGGRHRHAESVSFLVESFHMCGNPGKFFSLLFCNCLDGVSVSIRLETVDEAIAGGEAISFGSVFSGWRFAVAPSILLNFVIFERSCKSYTNRNCRWSNSRWGSDFFWAVFFFFGWRWAVSFSFFFRNTKLKFWTEFQGPYE